MSAEQKQQLLDEASAAMQGVPDAIQLPNSGFSPKPKSAWGRVSAERLRLGPKLQHQPYPHLPHRPLLKTDAQRQGCNQLYCSIKVAQGDNREETEMADTFDTCLNFTLREEGGYVDDPADPVGRPTWE